MHRYDSSVRTSVLTSRFGMISVQQGEKRLGYVCNPRSLKEGTEKSRRMTDEIGISPERPIHFECN